MNSGAPAAGLAAPPLAQRPEWKALVRHHQAIGRQHLRQFFAEDAQRGERLQGEAAGWYLDYSKQRINNETLRLLLALAEACGLRERRQAHPPPEPQAQPRFIQKNGVLQEIAAAEFGHASITPGFIRRGA